MRKSNAQLSPVELMRLHAKSISLNQPLNNVLVPPIPLVEPNNQVIDCPDESKPSNDAFAVLDSKNSDDAIPKIDDSALALEAVDLTVAVQESDKSSPVINDALLEAAKKKLDPNNKNPNVINLVIPISQSEQEIEVTPLNTPLAPDTKLVNPPVIEDDLSQELIFEVETQLPAIGGEITSIDQCGNFKGAIKGLVNEKNHKKIVVLDLGLAEVGIVCAKDFYGTSTYISLINSIKGPRYLFSVVYELVAPEYLIEEVWAISARRNSQKSIPVINEDNRFLVLYDEIVQRAVDLTASDIHFEIMDGELSKIRLRIYGRLKDWKSFPSEMVRGALTAAYSKRTKSGTNSSGALSLERAMNTITEQVVNGKTYNGRFNGYPLVNGYDVVMRLLDSDPKSTIPGIESLGYSAHHVNEQILPAIRRNAGMMAIAGSTGSGKSTALRSFIYSIPDRDQLKIFGVEDPVEYLNPFMRQISVQRNSDDPDDVVKMKFLSALRSVLRMDPDVLMLGEIRDHDSASLASEFNRTGHRVFTTVHGDGCVDVLARLTGEEIGIHPSTLAAKKYLSAVMYQKLLPKLCPHCKKKATSVLPSKTIEAMRNKFAVNPDTMFCANEEGCPNCKVAEIGIAGTKGLTVVAEILTPNDSILALIRERDWVGVERAWRGSRVAGFDNSDMTGKTAFEHAVYKACEGLVDPQDIEADFESFETYQPYEIVK